MLLALALLACAFACGKASSISAASADDDASPADDDDEAFGFVVCAQDTSDALQKNIVSVSAPMSPPATLVAVSGHSAIDPVTTPDGQTLIFSANFENPTPSGNDPPGGSLYKMPVAGGPYARITSDDWTMIYERFPAVFPDGSTIIFSRSDKSIGPLEALDRLWLAQLDGSDAHPLFDDENPRNDNQAALSPDGTKVTYLSDNDGVYFNVMAYDLNAGGAAVKLTNYTAVSGGPSSPFFDSTGQWVYYELGIDGYSLNRVPVSGGDPEKLFDIPAVNMPNHGLIDVAAYDSFKPTADGAHFVLIGSVNDAFQVFTADSLTSPLGLTAVTSTSFDCEYPYWHRP